MRLLISIIAIGFLSPYFAPATKKTAIQAVEQRLCDAAGKVRSFRANVAKTSNTSHDGEQTVIEGKGTIEFMRKEKNYLLHDERKVVVTVKHANKESRTERTTLLLCDGDTFFSYWVEGDHREVGKMMPPECDGVLASALFFRNLRHEYKLRLLPDEKMDGAEVNVVAGESRQARAMYFVKAVFYIRKDSGVIVKQVFITSEGDTHETEVLTELQINKPIDAARFHFEIPKDVKVIDFDKD